MPFSGAPEVQRPRPPILTAVLLAFILLLTVLVPFGTLILISQTNPQLMEGLGGFAVLIYAILPVSIISVVVAFLLGRVLLKRRGWRLPGFSVVIAALAGSTAFSLAPFLPSNSAKLLILPVAAALTIFVTVAMYYVRAKSRAVTWIVGIVLLLGAYVISGQSAHLGGAKISGDDLAAINVPVWLPQNPALKFAPYREYYRAAVGNESAYLKLDTPSSLEIYESPAVTPGKTPECGPMYSGSIDLTDSCHAAGEVRPGLTAYANQDGDVYATFGATLVVVSPVNARNSPTKETESMAYLKSFKLTDSTAAATQISNNSSKLNNVVEHQADLMTYQLLLPVSLPSGYKQSEMRIEGLDDPETPRLELTYSKSDGRDIYVSVRSSKQFTPPGDCGPVASNDSGINPCHLSEKVGAMMVYVSENKSYGDYYFVLTGDTVVGISGGDSTQDTLLVARSLSPMPHSTLDKALHVQY